MKVRLRDWASLNCISERTVQVHIKENQEELYGHIERKGKQGTWLDEFAQDFLINKIQLPNRNEIYQPTAKEHALMIELVEANKKAAEAEHRASINAEAAGKVQMLEAHNEDQRQQIDTLTRENALVSAERDDWKGKATDAEKSAQELSNELTAIKNKWYYKLFARKK